MKEFVTVKGVSVGEYEEKKSKFIATLLPVKTEEEASAVIDEIRKKKVGARHNVYAFRLSEGTERSSDDGEPSGTGGKPLLEILKAGNVDEEYRRVIQEFDIFLSEHGYERKGNYYKVTKPNNDTIAFFCHFGLGCVLFSHLLGISPMVLWHGFCAAPTSVTTVVTEERREGIASFRMSSYGDISHLYAKNEEPSFAARFCECYKNDHERHD